MVDDLAFRVYAVRAARFQSFEFSSKHLYKQQSEAPKKLIVSDIQFCCKVRNLILKEVKTKNIGKVSKLTSQSFNNSSVEESKDFKSSI